MPPLPVLRPDLLAAVRPFLKVAGRVELQPLSPAAPAGMAKYGGDPARPSSLPWPVCGGCGGALSFLAQFHARDRFWRLFVCQACTPWDDEERRRGMVRLEHGPLSDASLPAQPSPHDTGWVPHAWVVHPILSPPLAEEDVAPRTLPAGYLEWLDTQGAQEDLADDDTAAVFASWGAWPGPGTQLGGYAHFIQSPPALPACPECARDLVLLARLDSEDEVNLMWGDLGAAYLHVCPEHPDVQHYEMQCY